MPNALASEKSPYLRQHAENPVAWQPWGEAAFAQARAEQKPLFLSIGYATCHWCHVMAHESFENTDVAALLNEFFVPVKVDREERPDVDKVYMAYVQALTGHGGWPLSAWLTPELKPFFGGTYFPPEDRGGRAGFATILRAIAKGWASDREKLVAEGERVLGALREHAGEARGAPGPDAAEAGALAEAAGEAFEKCFQYFYEGFDATHGGFGGAPKFPRASNLNFLFRVTALQGLQSEVGAEAVKLAAATLQAMARGGLHDHVGGGFHRYAVDEAWFVPHFEKMLYDQAQIAINALEARQATKDERFAWMARDILGYVLAELSHPEGGFYSAEDADSVITAGKPEHAEGAFYVWMQGEIAAELGGDAPLVCAHFGVAEAGNVPEHLDPQGELRGKNILVQRSSLAATAKAFGLDAQTASDRLQAAMARLRAARARRPRPLRDDKIIAAWNGWMISAFAKAGQVLVGDDEAEKSERKNYLGAATRAAEFLRRELFDETRGVLFRSWREGRGAAEGFAEDYAAVIQGLLDLYEATFEVRWLEWSEQLQRTMDALFWDEAAGGYFNSRADDAAIVLRLKDDYDGAEPAASSVAAMNLARLGTILDGAGESAPSSYRGRARRCVAAFRARWAETPHALPQMLCALEAALQPPAHVVIAGDPARADFQALAAVLHENPGPRRALLAATGESARGWLVGRAPWLAEMKPHEGQATAYVCEEYACQAPVTTPAELRAMLRRGGN